MSATRLKMRAGAICLLVVLLGCSDRKASANPEASSQKAQAVAKPPSLEGLPVDLKDLRDDEKVSFGKLVQKYPSACKKAHSLEVSLRTDPGCKRSVFAARYIVKLLKLHLLQSEVEEQYEERFSAPSVSIDTQGAPVRGETTAPVSIVEFSDFQCPHCKRLQPVLERVLEEYRGQVKLVFKQYPLTSVHPDAAGAAAGALAAGKQGKFWQFHDKLFGGDQEHEAMADLEKVARDLKLDLKKWQADLETARTQVAKDRADGEKLEINSTPTMFVGGKKYHGGLEFDDLKDWIDEELNR
jgi:protein-disulfide isomerase